MLPNARIAGPGGIGIDSAGTDSPRRTSFRARLESHVITKSTDDLRALIREVPDFPKPGILFYDITTLLKDPQAFRSVIDHMAEQVRDTKIDIVVGMESRGFIFSAPLAYQLNAGFVPVRKLGKLPAETIEVEYELEYGTATLEIHRDAIQPGQRVLIVDDLLATGGTVMGTIELVHRLGGEIAGLSFMVELTGLRGRDKLDEFQIFTLLTY
jgi:adenine phosphoribosyltransferase